MFYRTMKKDIFSELFIGAMIELVSVLLHLFSYMYIGCLCCVASCCSIALESGEKWEKLGIDLPF